MQWYAVEVDKMTRIDGNSEDDFSLSEVEVEEEEEEERNKGKAMEHRFRSARSLHVEVLLSFPFISFLIIFLILCSKWHRSSQLVQLLP